MCVRFAAAVRKAESDGRASAPGLGSRLAVRGEQAGTVGRATVAAMERESGCCVRVLRKCASVAGAAQFASLRAHDCMHCGGLTRDGNRYRLEEDFP